MSKSTTKTAEELSLFSAQCALVLRSGMLLSEGLFAAAEEAGDCALSKVAGKLNAGGTLRDALLEDGSYPQYMVALVDIGEKSGRLEQVMDSLAEYYQREQAIRRQLKNTLFYPLLLALVMLLVVAVLLIKVLPVFSDVYAQLGGAYGISSGVLSFGRIAGIVCLALIGILVLAGLFVYFSTKTSAGYERLVSLLAALPFARRVADKISSGRVAYALSLLLSSGYDIDSAVVMLPGILAQSEAIKKVELISNSMGKGESFATAAKENGLFSGVYARLVSLGEQSGTMDEVMTRLSTMYDAEIEEGLSSLLGAVEPAIVAVLSAIIGVVLLSVMLPLLQILSAF